MFQVDSSEDESMPRMRTNELLDRIEKGAYQNITLKGLQNGAFYLLLSCADGTFIYENDDGNIKEYPKVDNALVWLRRMTNAKTVHVDIEIWRDDIKGK
jgi:hypothetical protein